MRFFIALFLAFIHSISLFAQLNDPNLEKWLIKKMRKAEIVGMQVAYIDRNLNTYTESFGLKNYQSKVPVNDSTLFLIASCSKPVTALAILKLYSEGKIDLDANINTYLPFGISNPHFPADSISVRMLLSHTSSLKDNWNIMDPLYTLEKGGDSPIPLSKFVRDYFLPKGKFYHSDQNFFNKNPGTYWEYCNMGYTLLGYVIEQVSKMDFSTYMQKEIFIPLGMKHSYWFLKEIPHDNIAHPHELPDKKSELKEPRVLKHYGYPDFPDGQLRTTVSDYSRLIKLILNDGNIDGKSFLKKETIALFYTIQFPDVHKYQAVAFNFDEFDHWLYYLFIKRYPSHTGGDPGVATLTSYDPNKKIAAIIFLNSPPTSFKGGKIFYLDIPKKLLKQEKK